MLAPRPRITVIAAVADNGVIGADNRLPWRLPEDLGHFRRLTMGHPIIMGRKTFESLGRLLPGRSHVVVSRNRSYAPAGCIVVASLAEAVSAAAGCPGGEEAFIVGGAEIYSQALPLADCLQLTEIHQAFAGDTYFPDFDRQLWRETARESHCGEGGLAFDFVAYERRQAG